MFGARCSTELTSDITHVVAAKVSSIYPSNWLPKNKAGHCHRAGVIRPPEMTCLQSCLASCYRPLPTIADIPAFQRGTVKVDTARKRGGIKIVWLAWFTDSIALWRRQDEKPYLLDDPPMPGPSASPAADSQLVSSDVDVDSDDWDQDPPEHKATATLDFGAVNWDEINDEVEAFMNESDEEDEGDGKSERSAAASEDEWASENG